LRLLAEGGMSLVYEVENVRLPGRFALKLMRDWAGDETVRATITQQFSQEAELLATLSHPNLPRVTDHFVSPTERWLVEELVEGETFEQLLEQTRPDEQTAVGWAVQILDALEYLHERGIIYRDLKPSNCMLTPQGVVKLIDFGIVRQFTLGKSRDTVVMGTPGFAAPEQYGRNQTDPRSDLFALGVLLHHLLTGHDPALTPFVFPAVRSLNPQVSERLERILLKALELDPRDRFQTAADMRAALRGEVVLPVENEVFSYHEELPPQRTRSLQRAAVVGSGVGVTWLVSSSWVFVALGAAYLPLWLFLLSREFRSQEKRASTMLSVSRQGLLWRQGQASCEATWAQVRSVKFVREGFVGVRAAHVDTEVGEFDFVLEASTTAQNLLCVHALPEAERLLELIVRAAELRVQGANNDVYVKATLATR
jgi:serine/threonine protein kinase